MIGRLWRKTFANADEPVYLIESDVPSQRDDGAITPEEVFHDAAARFLDVQISTNDILDNKGSQAFSIGSTVLPVTFGLLGLSEREPPIETVVTLAMALAAYVVLVGCVVLGSRIRILEYRPDLLTLQQHTDNFTGAVLQKWVASEYVVSTELNKAHLQAKGVWIGRAYTALYGEGFLLSLAAIFALR